MTEYESFFVLDVNQAEGKAEETINGIEQIIVKNEGKVEKKENWGKKSLAYEVKGNKEGLYFALDFKSKPKAIRELEKLCRLDSTILRHLVLQRQWVSKKKKA